MKNKTDDNPIIGYEHTEIDGKLVQGNPIYLKDLPKVLKRTSLLLRLRNLFLAKEKD